MKNQKGITLVALIITIIVMVILAGVIIVSAVADGGIIDRAESAIKEKEKADAEELIIAGYVYKTTASTTISGRLDLDATADAIYENLTTNGFVIPGISSGDELYTGGNVINLNIQGKYGNYTGTVTEKGLENGLNEGDNDEIVIPGDTTPPRDTTPPTSGGVKLYEAVTENSGDYVGKRIEGYSINGVSDWLIYDAIESEKAVRIVPYYSTGETSGSGTINTEKYKYVPSLDGEENITAINTICKKYIDSNLAKFARNITTAESYSFYGFNKYNFLSGAWIINDQTNLAFKFSNYTYNDSNAVTREEEYNVLPIVTLKEDVLVKESTSADYLIYK